MTETADISADTVTRAATAEDVRVHALAPVHVRAADEQDVPLRIFTAPSSKAKEYATDLRRGQRANDQSEII